MVIIDEILGGGGGGALVHLDNLLEIVTYHFVFFDILLKLY